MRFLKLNLLFLAAAMLFSCGGKRSPESHEVWGLDISRHQQSVDWKTLIRYDPPHFVFLKATEGTMIVDPTYKKHRRDLRAAGIPCGAYHFFGHRTPGKEQAKAFIKTAGLKKGDLLPVLDIEKHRFMTDPAKSVKEALAFCSEIKRHYGEYPIIYCSTNFYNDYLKDDFSPKKYHLWIADYRGSAPDIQWKIWQHTEEHTIKGIRGKVDRNVLAGGPDELEKLIL